MDFDLSEFLGELSHYELIDAYYSVRSALVSDVTIFMTILFGYVTVAYFVSAKLSRFQAFTISTIYSLFALYMASSAYNSSRMQSVFGYEISGVDSTWESVVIAIILGVSWFFSIVLFVQARKKGIT